MELTVENGTGLSGADSYASIASANAYHAALGNDEWRAASLPTATFTARRQPNENETATVGGVTLTFVASSPAADEVKIGATIAETLANLAAALTYDVSAIDVKFGAGTTFDDSYTASASGNSLTITARSQSDASELDGYLSASSPNSITSAFLAVPESARAALRKATQYIDATYGQRFYGEKKTQGQALAWPRSYAMDGDGFTIDDESVPEAVVQATCEAALTIVRGGLVLTDVQPDSGASLTSESVSLGSISISQSFASPRDPHTRMPKVEALLAAVAVSGGTLLRG